MARADARIDEHLADRLRESAEAAGTGVPGSSGSGMLPGMAAAGAPDPPPGEAGDDPAPTAGSAHADADLGDGDMS
eukprot:9244761-Prorocentrum_lima.AAC.1